MWREPSAAATNALVFLQQSLSSVSRCFHVGGLSRWLSCQRYCWQGFLLFVFVVVIVVPTLPSLEVLTDYQPKVPLRVLQPRGTADRRIRRRASRSGPHCGRTSGHALRPSWPRRRALLPAWRKVDYVGVIRAAMSNFASGGARQGCEHDHHAGCAKLFSVKGENANPQIQRKCCSRSRLNTV
jgi:hypothetical protein